MQQKLPFGVSKIQVHTQIHHNIFTRKLVHRPRHRHSHMRYDTQMSIFSNTSVVQMNTRSENENKKENIPYNLPTN